MKKIKSEKGSITLYVLFSMLFFMAILIGLYTSTSNKLQKQERDIKKIQQSYDNQNAEELYQRALEANS